jgi:BolA protein
MNRQERIEHNLQSTFQPSELEVTDESHLHVGHPGARDGRGHFRVHLRAPAFTGQSAVKRHQMVYQALGEMMQTDIHALSIKALDPDE